MSSTSGRLQFHKRLSIIFRQNMVSRLSWFTVRIYAKRARRRRIATNRQVNFCGIQLWLAVGYRYVGFLGCSLGKLPL